MSDDTAVRKLYRTLLGAWDRRDAAGFAVCFHEHGHTVGFDGSMLDGRAAIETVLAQIFASHPTPSYVAIERGVTFPGPGAALLRAVAGMVPPGTLDINPAVNAIQSMVASKHDGEWRIDLFQNTPAAFHGRPHESAQLTEELRAVLARTTKAPRE